MSAKFKNVPLPDVHTLPKNVQELINQLPALNVYKMFANVPSSLPPFTDLAKAFFNDGGVDTRLLEIGILRIAHLNSCEYQWHQHAEIAKSVGMNEREILIISTEQEVKSLKHAENFMCKIADELTRNANLNEKTFDELFTQYSVKQGVAIIMCISFYNMLSRFLNATRVQLEKNNPLKGKSSPVN